MGINLVIVGRDNALMQQLSQRLQAEHKVNITPLTIDLAEPAAADTIFKATEDNNLQIDFLINNAGYPLYRSRGHVKCDAKLCGKTVLFISLKPCLDMDVII